MITKHSISLGAFLACFIASGDTFPTIRWQQGFVSQADYYSASSYTRDMAQTADGGCVLVGTTVVSTIPYAYGFLIKIDGNGTIQWNRTITNLFERYFSAVIATGGGGYLLGGATKQLNNGDWDVLVVKVDGMGQTQWEQVYRGYKNDGEGSWGMTSGVRLLALGNGDYLIGTTSDSPISLPYGVKTAPNYGSSDFWLLRIEPTHGGLIWDRTFGGSDEDVLASLCATEDGGVLLGGSSWSPSSGNKTAPHRGFFDYWVVKVDGDGNKQWDKSYGGSGDDRLSDMVPTGDGGFLLAGSSGSPADGTKTAGTFGYDDYWAVRIDKDGNVLWDHNFGGAGEERFVRVLKTTDGGFLLGGPSNSDSSGNKTAPAIAGGSCPYSQCDNSYWIVKVDGNGNKQWDQIYGGTGEDMLTCMLATQDGDYLLAGYSDSKADGNKTTGGTLGRGIYAVWVLKVAASVPPLISAQPESRVVTAGMAISLSVTALSFTQPIFYQWRFSGTNVLGATNATLSLPEIQATNGGTYQVTVSNLFGHVDSAVAILTYTDAANLILGVHPSLTIFGEPGKTYRVDYSEDLEGVVNWTALTNVTIITSPLVWVDASQPAVGSKRFYRVLLAP